MDNKLLWAERHIRLKRCREGALIYNINDRFIGRGLDKYGEISRGEALFLGQIIRPGMTVVEVGANIGLLTIPFARFVAPAGKVIAFEPQRIVHQMLCGNIALNALENVFTHNSAVGRICGSIMVPPVDYAQIGNFGGIELGAATRGEQVPLVTIDSLRLEQCDFMKIDVEGMELEVLQGAASTLRQFCPFLYIENDRVHKSRALIGHLLELDYRLYWHTPYLYREDNFFQDAENIFPGTLSDNMIGVPKTRPLIVNGLTEIASADALPPWRAAAAAKENADALGQ